MNSEFSPPHQPGLVFNLVLIVLLSAGAAWSLSRAISTPVGPEFGGYLLLFLVFGLPAPLATYRLYSLLRSSYRLQTGSIRLAWGLRVEDVPLEDIVRVYGDKDLDFRLPLPVLRWPGAWVGVRRINRRTRVEFLAARGRGLVLIETARRIYAISPEDPAGFLHAFQRITEIGTLDPVRGESVQPAAVVGSLWENAPARGLVIAAAALAAGFAAWILVGVRPAAGLQFPLEGTDRFVNGSQLLIMPVLNLIYMMVDLFLGLFFFRREETRPLAFILWTSSVLVSVFFFAAVSLLIQ